MQSTSAIPAPAFANMDTPNSASNLGVGKVLPLAIKITEGPDRDVDFALYDVHLSTGVKEWIVSRRYSDFQDLKNDLDPLISDEEKDMFPPKHFFHGSKATGVVQERLDKLPAWLMAISRHPAVSLHPHFRAFLALDQHEGDLRNALEDYRAKRSAASQAPALSPVSNVSLAGSYESGLEASSDATVFRQSATEGIKANSSTETAKATALPSEMDPNFRSATVSVSAPTAAGPTMATEEVQVDVQVPRADISEARAMISKASKDVEAAKDLTMRARALDERAVQAEKESEQLAVAACQASNEVVVVAERRDALIAQVQQEKASAELLEREALEKRRRAGDLAGLAADRERDLQRLEKLAESRMEAYNHRLKEAEQLTQMAKDAHEQAKRRQLIAIRDQELAAAEMMKAEQEVAEAATLEATRHAAEAAAAAARAKHEMAQAARLKADEEAAISAAHVAAREEAQCAAEVEILEQRLSELRARKKEYELVAHAAEKASGEETREAAKDAAAVDAHSKAIGIIKESADVATRMANRAEDELIVAERLEAKLTKEQNSTVLRMPLQDFTSKRAAV